VLGEWLRGHVAQLSSDSAGMVCFIRVVMGSASSIKEGRRLSPGGSGHILITMLRVMFGEKTTQHRAGGLSQTTAGCCVRNRSNVTVRPSQHKLKQAYHNNRSSGSCIYIYIYIYITLFTFAWHNISQSKQHNEGEKR
jgi:hypothetical protein